ncbi:MAG: glycine C-acetyltransferase [Candidatus Thermoplasmatota archaeon]|nr:glycine C-acetyltransferase [Candidatus Thermoplasmatota archaeon]
MKSQTAFLKEEYEELVRKDWDWKLLTLESASDARTVINGKEVVMLCSNNYLGLCNNPKLKEAAIKATEKYGVGSGAVRPIAGTMTLHSELENKIAEFKRTDAALYYQSGFVANSGLIPQLVDKGDIIISDELNHGSIIDGVRLSRAERMVYPHKDMAGLEKCLKESQDKYRRILVISDGVFSMDGDIAPLPEIVKLAEKYHAISYIDDAHGDGVLGENGRGISAHFHLEGKVDVEMGTFSKAFGTVGGYIAGSKDLRNFALNKSRSWLLSGSMPPGVVASCIRALEIIEKEPERIRKLWENTRYFKKELQALGLDTGISETPITPVIVGESKLAKELSKSLFENGVYGYPIVFPMVARDKARIRTIVTAAHTKEDLNFALNAFEKCCKELKII